MDLEKNKHEIVSLYDSLDIQQRLILYSEVSQSILLSLPLPHFSIRHASNKENKESMQLCFIPIVLCTAGCTMGMAVEPFFFF